MSQTKVTFLREYLKLVQGYFCCIVQWYQIGAFIYLYEFFKWFVKCRIQFSLSKYSLDV